MYAFGTRKGCKTQFWFSNDYFSAYVARGLLTYGFKSRHASDTKTLFDIHQEASDSVFSGVDDMGESWKSEAQM